MIFVIVLLGCAPAVSGIMGGAELGGWVGGLVGLVVGGSIGIPSVFVFKALITMTWKWGCRRKEQKLPMTVPRMVWGVLWGAVLGWNALSGVLAMLASQLIVHFLLKS